MILGFSAFQLSERLAKTPANIEAVVAKPKRVGSAWGAVFVL